MTKIKIICAAAIASCLVGCGSSGSTSTLPSATDSAQTGLQTQPQGSVPEATSTSAPVVTLPKEAATPGSSKAQIQNIYADTWSAISAGQGKDACANMTSKYRKMLVSQLTVGQSRTSCERAVAEFAAAAKTVLQGRQSSVTKIRIKGSSATAVVNYALPNSPLTRSRLSLTKSSGRWLLDREVAVSTAAAK